MSASTTERTLDELTLDSKLSLEDLVDRGALREMVHSFYELFRIPLRIYSEDGVMLSDVSEQPAIYAYLNEFRGSREALLALVQRVKGIDPKVEGEISQPCITGAVYQVFAIQYDGRQIGRLILGPFRSPEHREVPRELLELDPGLELAKLKPLLGQLPLAGHDTVAHIARHLKGALDLILFSGHKALLTTNMHLASVRESFRELQEKNAKLQDAYNRLKELDRLKSNFLATVSHELRTPLTSIIGYSEMLAEGIAGDMTDEQKEFVTTIHDKGEQLLELIMGLLDLSKLESGTMSLNRREIDVEPLLQDVANTLQPTARKKGVNLVARDSLGLPGIWADPERLRQVLLNLTENAIKFTPEGGTVELSADGSFMDVDNDDADGGGMVLFSNKRPAVDLIVTDSGIGIPDHEKQRVFDAFYQVDGSSTREAGGTGLGLSIVKRLVDAHDGRIDIRDNEPHGAQFVVTLPRRRASLSG
ncbi:MAG: PocR ligand-binding domain-containing protein [Polyangiaceae bacterium]|nr:PocR ligand-binding domain-containing protein [Polyangiaceae bacterium]MCB9607876.1 PocR ligand-binding domain-containing protein [Polyangiaceae bacterium]